MRDGHQEAESTPTLPGFLQGIAIDVGDTTDELEIGYSAKAGIVLRGPAHSPSSHDETDALADLMALVRREDATAFKALHDRCASRLLGAALRVVSNRHLAEEAVSTALLQAWRLAADFNPARGTVMTWLCTLVRSRAVDLIRRDRTRGKYECSIDDLSMDDLDGHGMQPADDLARTQSRHVLRRAMSLLSPMQRHVLSLTFLQGHSQEEAAAQIGMPLGTLKSHARRGLAVLRQHRGLGQLNC